MKVVPAGASPRGCAYLDQPKIVTEAHVDAGVRRHKRNSRVHDMRTERDVARRLSEAMPDPASTLAARASSAAALKSASPGGSRISVVVRAAGRPRSALMTKSRRVTE